MFTNEINTEDEYSSIFVHAIDGFYDLPAKKEKTEEFEKSQPWKAFSKKYNKNLETEKIPKLKIEVSLKEEEVEIDNDFLKKLSFDFDQDETKINSSISYHSDQEESLSYEQADPAFESKLSPLSSLKSSININEKPIFSKNLAENWTETAKSVKNNLSQLYVFNMKRANIMKMAVQIQVCKKMAEACKTSQQKN